MLFLLKSFFLILSGIGISNLMVNIGKRPEILDFLIILFTDGSKKELTMDLP